MNLSCVKSLLLTLETDLFDWMLGIRTFGVHRGPDPQGAAKADSEVYQSKAYSLIWQCRRPLNLGPADIFFDIGCGAGRVLCVVARKRIGLCVGIELSKALYDQASKNVELLRGRRTNVELVWADAALTDYDKGTVYFLFNPFGPRTLEVVVKKIFQSTMRDPRHVRIVYLNPTAAHVIESSGFLRLVRKQEFWGSDTVCCHYDNRV